MSEALQRVVLHDSWKRALRTEFEADYMQKIRDFLLRERKNGKVIYPPLKNIFRALDLCPLEEVRVVILGQDPYINPRQAHGLSFSVTNGEPPPSLQNIFKEIVSDLQDESVPGGRKGGFIPRGKGCLEPWARQGVLLLNANLTVEASKSGSHHGIGWERFTDRVVEVINAELEYVVFLLWGSHAKRKGDIVDRRKHLVLTSAHPSPLSVHRGFFGCRHFSQTNKYLVQHGIDPIDWFEVE